MPTKEELKIMLKKAEELKEKQTNPADANFLEGVLAVLDWMVYNGDNPLFYYED